MQILARTRDENICGKNDWTIFVLHFLFCASQGMRDGEWRDLHNLRSRKIYLPMTKELLYTYNQFGRYGNQLSWVEEDRGKIEEIILLLLLLQLRLLYVVPVEGKPIGGVFYWKRKKNANRGHPAMQQHPSSSFMVKAFEFFSFLYIFSYIFSRLTISFQCQMDYSIVVPYTCSSF